MHEGSRWWWATAEERGRRRWSRRGYLQERQPALDYRSLDNPRPAARADSWAGLEGYHRGIDSLSLPPEVATARKQRLSLHRALPRRSGRRRRGGAGSRR